MVRLSSVVSCLVVDFWSSVVCLPVWVVDCWWFIVGLGFLFVDAIYFHYLMNWSANLWSSVDVGYSMNINFLKISGNI